MVKQVPCFSKLLASALESALERSLFPAMLDAFDLLVEFLGFLVDDLEFVADGWVIVLALEDFFFCKRMTPIQKYANLGFVLPTFISSIDNFRFPFGGICFS